MFLCPDLARFDVFSDTGCLLLFFIITEKKLSNLIVGSLVWLEVDNLLVGCIGSVDCLVFTVVVNVVVQEATLLSIV